MVERPTGPTTMNPGMTTECFYEDVKVGDTGAGPEVTVTAEMIRTYADLTGDHTPIHVDEEYAKTTIFGRIVAHGLLGLALADGLKTRADLQFPPGASLGWSWDFLRPIHVGDTLRVEFTVGSMRTTSKPDWGIVVLPSRLINQRGEVVQKGEHKLMVRRRPSAVDAS